MQILDKPVVVLFAAAYLASVVAIGVWAATRTRDARDFFIAGQRLGLVVTGMATMSAAFSGFVFLGGPGLTYELGVGSLWIVLPVGLTGGLLCWVVAGKLRRLAGEHEIYTVPDAIAHRFPGRAVHVLSAVAVAIGSVAYLGAQILALGVLLQTVFGIERPVFALLLGLGVLVAYSVLGGMVAGVYTDLLQGTLMLGAALLIFVQAIRVTGGWRQLTGSLSASDGFLEPLGRLPATTAFALFFVFCVGVLGQPQMLHKFFMLRDPAKLRWMPLVLGASQSTCLLVWIGIGLAVPALVAQGRLAPLADPDRAAPTFLLEFAPDALAGLVLAAVLAAIMSSADSFLNIGSAALVRDLPRALGRSLGHELTRGRIAVVAIAAAAATLAWGYGDLIALLGTFAFGTFAAALAPTLTVGLNWKRAGSVAAASSITVGLVLNLGLESARRVAGDAWPGHIVPSAVALAASFAVMLGVSWAAPRR